MDTIVNWPDIQVLRVRADMNGAGPKAAFDSLESRLPTIKGRRFYGTIRFVEHVEEYYACVERLDGDDPARLGLEVAAIPGGKYVRRKVWDWERVVAAGKMREITADLALRHELDPQRPTIEYYRSMRELHVLLPLATPSPPGVAPRGDRVPSG